MNDELYHISYFSRSSLKGSDDDVKIGIESILNVAQQRNAQQGVTGALLYSGGYFIQVLEGKEEAVEEIFESIQCDTRHYDVVVIDHAHMAERSFPKWSMALAGFDPELLPGLDDLLKEPEDISANPKGVELVQMLSSLLKRYEEEGV